MPEDSERSESAPDDLDEAVRRAKFELAELQDLARRMKMLQRRYSTIIPQPEMPDDFGTREN